ncbi:MAG TPA: Rieske 2Fe-2S domain-containing protein [Acidobacteriaceae bacterium]|jgi:Rieske Fe-S protein|nr:Rieske 2Fe-2S domain-containing protein [Acidobacteriaceae bacterium]
MSNEPDTAHEPETLEPEGSNKSAAEKAAAHTRRAFLFKLSLLLNGAVGAVLAVPILGYVLGPALRKNSSYNSWVSLGDLSDFPVGETRLMDYKNPVTMVTDGDTAKVSCWVRRIDASKFQIFAINCAHLGCPVRWFAQSKLFMCPCHGGAYYEDGSRASGPPERGLFEYQYRISGQTLMIHAGEMPTLANQACLEKSGTKSDPTNHLVQLQTQSPAQPIKDGSSQARSNSWPA